MDLHTLVQAQMELMGTTNRLLLAVFTVLQEET